MCCVRRKEVKYTMEKHDYDSLASRFLPYLVYLTEAHSAEKI
jgi:hypothetical protein